MGMGDEIRYKIARRAAQDIGQDMVVNLGIGIPSLVANYVSADLNVLFQVENGILGVGSSPAIGEEDPMLCNAGGYPVTVVPGASYFDSTVAFGMIRKGYIDITILGALEVSARGDLANWIVPGQRVPGMGGAMDLAQKAQKVIVLMNHRNKKGESKILPTCTLPLTAVGCVDLIITDMAVIEVTTEGLVLREVMSPFSVEDVVQSTVAPLQVAADIVIL